MNTKNYLISEAVLLLLFGIPLLFFPQLMSDQYLTNASMRNDVTDLLCQLFGLALLSGAVANFNARNTTNSPARTGIILMGVILNWGCVIVHTLSIQKGIEQNTTWLTVGINAIWGLWGLWLLNSKK